MYQTDAEDVSKPGVCVKYRMIRLFQTRRIQENKKEMSESHCSSHRMLQRLLL